MFIFYGLWFSICLCFVTCEFETYRLSLTEAFPTNYHIKITPDFDNENFCGEVAIYAKTHDNLEKITFHSSNLNISEVQINQRNANFKEESEERISVFYKNNTIQPGEQLINIKYTGFIKKNNGFIKAVYEDKERKVYLFVTDLEPTYARTVFPCFDEPSFKANFSVRLVSPNDTYKAISNMPEINKFKTEDGSVVYDFATSVKMSTYLLSFAFTDPNYTYYEDIVENKGNKIPVKIHTVNASKENNEFAFNCTRTALTFYSDYTNISYPMPKLDMIEYRRNLTAASENWGLITFREGLLTPALRIYNKYQIKLVVFHELGHFWFGNLVTNKWWDDLWLQEGFATYMSYKLLAKDGGKKNVVEEMRTFSFNDYFDIEIYSNKSSIVTYLPKHENIEEAFNDLVYYKGAAVLLMLEDLIGEEKFQQIIRKFLLKHIYSTATTNDFISTVEEVANDKPLRHFLEGFLFQRKYPVVSVHIEDNSTYVLSQEPSECVNMLGNKGEKWTIPLTYQTDSTNISRLWFDKDMDRVQIQLPDAKWFLLNPNGIGIYRTVMSNKLWDQIIDHFDEISVSMSETILLDIYYSFRLNKISCDVFLKLMDRLRNKKDDRAKWMYFHTMIEHIKDNLSCNEHKDEVNIFMKYVRKRLEEIGYTRNPLFLEAECDSQYIIKGQIYKENLNQCAKWIRENLKESDSNTINPT